MYLYACEHVRRTGMSGHEKMIQGWIANRDSTDKVREKCRVGKCQVREILNEMERRPTEMMIDKK